jgi:hypothetical protein
MNNINIIGLTLQVLENGNNQIRELLEKEFDVLAENCIDSSVLEFEQSEKLQEKLSLLGEMYNRLNETQEIIKTCKTLHTVYNGIGGIQQSQQQLDLLPE